VLSEVREWAEELACRAGLDGLRSAGRRILIGVLVAAVCVAGAAWLSGGPTTATQSKPGAAVPPAGSAGATSSALPALLPTVTVHVVGEVRRPGVYALPGGSRAADAVAAAGGMLGAADQCAVNLARVVADGEQVAIPRQGETVSTAPGGGTGRAAKGTKGSKVDLNTATEAQLDTLPGIGPSTAQKIVADRTANGPFRTVDDLMRVPGIGPSKLEALKDLVNAG
jgi:competence protein ComEA